ncbi:autophagy- protein 2 [Blyttiomyces sp. JEL0837]|nr:autophagy- protein 2 [Blyttiomyces sp. JEL0837]
MLGQVCCNKTLLAGKCSSSLEYVEYTTSESPSEETPILASSVHFAGDFLRSEVSDEDYFDQESRRANSTSTEDGIKLVASLFDKVMATARFSARNTTLRLLDNSRGVQQTGLFWDIKFPEITYNDPDEELAQLESSPKGASGVLEESSTKVLNFSGFSIVLGKTEEDGEQSMNSDATVLFCPFNRRNSVRIAVKHALAHPETPEDTSPSVFHTASTSPEWDITVCIDDLLTLTSLRHLGWINSFFKSLPATFKVQDEDLKTASSPESARHSSNTYAVKMQLASYRLIIVPDDDILLTIKLSRLEKTSASEFIENDHLCLELSEIKAAVCSLPTVLNSPGAYNLTLGVTSAKVIEVRSSGQGRQPQVVLEMGGQLDSESIKHMYLSLRGEPLATSFMERPGLTGVHAEFVRAFSGTFRTNPNGPAFVTATFGPVVNYMDLEVIWRLSEVGAKVQQVSTGAGSTDLQSHDSDRNSNPPKFKVEFTFIRCFFQPPPNPASSFTASLDTEESGSMGAGNDLAEDFFDADEDVSRFGLQSWLDLGEAAQKPDNDTIAAVFINPLDLSRAKFRIFARAEAIQCFLTKNDYDLLLILANAFAVAISAHSVVGAAKIDSLSPLTEEDLLTQNCFEIRCDSVRLRICQSLEREDTRYLAVLKNISFAGVTGDALKASISAERLSLYGPNEHPLIVRTPNCSSSLRNLHVTFSLLHDSILDMKELKASVGLNGLTLHVDTDANIDVVADLKAFVAEPPGLLPIEEVDRFANITIMFSEVSIQYRTPAVAVLAGLGIRKFKMQFNIIPNSSAFAAKIFLHGVTLELLELSQLPDTDMGRMLNNYVKVLSLDVIELSWQQSDGVASPKFELDISNQQCNIDICADSYQSLRRLLDSISDPGNSAKSERRKSESMPPQEARAEVNLLASLEEDTFRPVGPMRDTTEVNVKAVENFDMFVDDGVFVFSDHADSGKATEDIDVINRYDNEDSFQIIENHFALVGGVDVDDDENLTAKLESVTRLRDINISIRLFDGNDWIGENSRHRSSQSGGFHDFDSYEASSNASEYQASPTTEFAPESSPTSPSPRSNNSRMELHFLKVNFEYGSYSSTSQVASKVNLSMRDFEILDNLQSSSWRKFLAPLRPNQTELPRESESKMISTQLVNVRPNPAAAHLEEARLKVHVLPLRWHIDQDALNFLNHFFESPESQEETEGNDSNSPSEAGGPFFQYCLIDPISMTIDYKPKHVDYRNLQEGNMMEIFNFLPLEGARMTLRTVKLTGIRGWPRLIQTVVGKWLPYVKATQVPRVISGVSGVNSIVNLGSGIADLVLLPIEQYRKDGRIIKGIQKGAKSFAKVATDESLRLGTRILVGTQTLLERADDYLSGDQANANLRDSGQGGVDKRSKFSEQPKDFREGVELGYYSVRENLSTAARTIMAVPTEVRQAGTAKAIVRAVPVAVLKPIIGATEAISKALMGLQNSLDPTKRLQMEDKYKA